MNDASPVATFARRWATGSWRCRSQGGVSGWSVRQKSRQPPISAPSPPRSAGWTGKTPLRGRGRGVRGPPEGSRMAPHPGPLPTAMSSQKVAPPVGRGGRGDPAAYLSDAHTSGWCGWSGSVFRLPTFWRTWLRESVRIGTIDKFGACEVDIPRGTDSPRDRGRRSPYAQSGVLPKRHIVGRRYAIIRVRGP